MGSDRFFHRLLGGTSPPPTTRDVTKKKRNSHAPLPPFIRVRRCGCCHWATGMLRCCKYARMPFRCRIALYVTVG